MSSQPQWEQYQSFLAGDKSLCVIEERKDSYTYSVVLHNTRTHSEYHVHAWHSPEGAEVVLAHDYRTISRYLHLLHDEQRWATRAAICRTSLGCMFGYDDDSIFEFVSNWTPDYCQCSKCVGVHKAIEVLKA